MTIHWTARDDGLLYYWCNAADTLDATVWLSGNGWHWDVGRYQAQERDAVGGVAATVDEAKRAAEAWVDAQAGE